MLATHRPLRAALYGLFALSGFAGLIYESIWTHYLKLFLGHAAYAQTLVLCIFMGGMALGAWLAGRYSQSIRQPLFAYAVVEAVLGCAALSFDAVFRPLHAWLFHEVLPQLGLPLAVDMAKWSLAVATILPQSILLGATFPLISAAVVRLEPSAAGRALGWLYFTNSIGAALGVLASGFVLIDLVGLPGTILTAGLINFALALCVYPLAKLASARSAMSDKSQTGASSSAAGISTLLIWTAALTGAASFFYEIAWIRMLSLVIGAATHSFELMLSAFITGLAMGSFYIRRRIDSLTDVRPLLGRIQLIMGTLAVLTIPIYVQIFEAMGWWMSAINRNASGYVLFTVFAHALCFVIMLPATFCAGMTLPLITSALLQERGEREIGRVYASNTLGSIMGVIVAVHFIMPLLGLRSVVLLGAMIDIGLGILLLNSGRVLGGRRTLGGSLIAAAVLIVVAAMVPFDPKITASGVYRQGQLARTGEPLFHKDGKTATVDVFQNPGMLSILTNGKVDAGLQADTDLVATADDYTMLLAALLPLSLNLQAQDAAVIGIGSGRTSHALLHAPGLASVDTIEIEPAMVEGARRFGAVSAKVFDDPRSHIYIEDAKAHFSRAQKSYDFIISEPSNPWVSGTANLFTKEFYAEVKRYLRPQGLLVQWLQLYEIDLTLVATVVNALSSEFADYEVYVTIGNDVLIVAKADGRLPRPDPAALQHPALAKFWRLMGIHTLNDLAIRRIGGRDTLMPWMHRTNSAINSDYFPILDQNAVRRRFMDADATPLYSIYSYSARLELGSARESADVTRPLLGMIPSIQAFSATALARYHAWREGRSMTPSQDTIDAAPVGIYENLWQIENHCAPEVAAVWLGALRSLTAAYAVYMPSDEVARIAKRLRNAKCLSAGGEEARLWLNLFEAVGTDNWLGIQSAAPELLNLPKMSQNRDFVIAELMLADLKSNGPDAALERFRQLKGPIPDSVPIHYLRANLGG